MHLCGLKENFLNVVIEVLLMDKRRADNNNNK